MITTTDAPWGFELPGKVDFFPDFPAELAGRSEHIISQEDAFRLTEVCRKARNAAESGTWTDV